jgi:hypothetical protein
MEFSETLAPKGEQTSLRDGGCRRQIDQRQPLGLLSEGEEKLRWAQANIALDPRAGKPFVAKITLHGKEIFQVGVKSR